MATPLMSTNTKTEPLSLELFNRAAADLNQKGEIELERYKKISIQPLLMDPAFKFLVNGLNMEFTIHLAADGCSIPDLLFVDILTEKCQLLHQHIRSYKDCLILVTNIGCTVATIKLFDKSKLDSQLLHFTVSNLWVLEEQLYRLWIEVCRVLKHYVVNNPLVELRNITDYYHSTAYHDMISACLL